jgi:hypothetical protein
MGRQAFNRFFGWVFILGMVAFLASLLFMLAMGWEPWTVAWLAVVTGSVIGMSAGIVLMIKAFNVGDMEGTST